MFAHPIGELTLSQLSTSSGDHGGDDVRLVGAEIECVKAEKDDHS